MSGQLGFYTGLVYAINIVIGAGFLGLAYGFKETGILLSSFYLAVISLINFYLGLMFLEVMDKAAVLKDSHDKGLKYDVHLKDILLTSSKSSDRVFYHHEYQHIDVTEAITIMFGNVAGKIYLGLLTLYLEISVVAYTSIFSSSLASNVPLPWLGTCNVYDDNSDCLINYKIYSLIFATLVIFLTVRGLKEQKTFQIIMCFMRFVVMIVITICALDAIINKLPVEGNKYHDFDVSLTHSNSFLLVVPLIVFSLMYQLLLPDVSAIIKNRQTVMWKILLIITIVIFILYAAVALSPIYAIPNINEQISLNFRNYSRGYADRPWWTYMVAYLVVLFPAFDVIASATFRTITISNNFRHAVFGHKRSYAILMFCRVFFSAVPIFIGTFAYNITTILRIVGIVPILIFHFTAPLAHLYVRTALRGTGMFDVKVFYWPINILLSLMALMLAGYVFMDTMNAIS